jgi:hypothetical protein
VQLNGGGRSLEDVREIKNDKGLRKVLRLKVVPSPDAYGDWRDYKFGKIAETVHTMNKNRYSFR